MITKLLRYFTPSRSKIPFTQLTSIPHQRCYSGGKSGWYDGELTGKFTAAHYSNLAAMTFVANAAPQIRVIYQHPDNTIRIYTREGEKAWIPGLTVGTGIQGSSIACSYVPGGTWTRFVYFQKPDTTFVEYISKDLTGWTLGGSFMFRKTIALAPLLNLTSHQRWLQVPARV